MTVQTFTVVTGGHQHFVRSSDCPECPPVWPRTCPCGDGRVHAEEHAIPGGWGPALVRYACDACGSVFPPEGAMD
jgi:hypothetical protein